MKKQGEFWVAPTVRINIVKEKEKWVTPGQLTSIEELGEILIETLGCVEGRKLAFWLVRHCFENAQICKELKK